MKKNYRKSNESNKNYKLQIRYANVVYRSGPALTYKPKGRLGSIKKHWNTCFFKFLFGYIGLYVVGMFV